MKRTGETQIIYRADDPVTKIGYKIIYVRSKDHYEIWIQYKEKNEELCRNRVTYEEVVRREHDLERLID